MATPETRAQLTIRPPREADAVMLREIFNEAVEDGMVTFASAPRAIEEQQRLIAEAQQDLRHPIMVAEVLNWTCGIATLEPHDRRHELDDIAEVQIFVRRSFRSYGVGRQLMRAVQAEAFLEGRTISPEAMLEAGRIAAAEARPITDFRASADYRRDLVAVLTRRALENVRALAQEA